MGYPKRGPAASVPTTILICNEGRLVAANQQEPAGLPPAGETDPAASGSGISVKVRLILLGAALALAVGFMGYSAFPGNVRYYLEVSEFLAGAEYQDGRTLRVSGRLAPDTFQRAGGGTQASFQLVDKEGDGAGPRLAAAYDGVMPDLFFNPHSEIILEGSYGDGGIFQADNILVKCPSKYQSIEGEPPADYNSPAAAPAAGAGI